MALFAAVPLAAAASACGVERWGAKVLSDGTAQLGGPHDATVARLRALPRPFGEKYEGARVAAERVRYRIQGELLGFRLESDGDLHVVIADPGNRSATLVAEIPDPKCMIGAPPQYVREVEQARLEFVRAFGIPPIRHYALAYKPITIVGPAFYDFEHGQSGSAPNDIEIHPTLIVDAGSSSPTSPSPVRGNNAIAADEPRGSSVPSCPGDALVEINPSSGIFYVPGSRWWRRLRHGQFMCKRAALANGYRAARNEL